MAKKRISKAYKYQKNHKVLQRERGLVQVQLWIPEDQKNNFKLLATAATQKHKAKHSEQLAEDALIAIKQ